MQFLADAASSKITYMTRPPHTLAPDVEERILQAPHLLLGLDYDGTLTPIVDDPALALLAPEMKLAIEALSGRGDVTVAIVSGRALVDLEALVGIRGLIYAGNHGMEIRGPGIGFREATAHAAAQDLSNIARDIGRALKPVPGVFVEDKGLTLSVHYRRVAHGDIAQVRQTVHTIVEAVGDRFHVTPGNMVDEVRPRLQWNKGTAIAWINEQLAKPNALTIYVGDDATDEDAFRLLADDAITIRVGAGGKTAAQVCLPDPAAVQQFLLWLHELPNRS